MNVPLLLAIGCAIIGVFLLFSGSKSRAGALGAFGVAAGTAASTGLMPEVLTPTCLILGILSVWQSLRHRKTP